jgi:Glycine-rich domain-containing protein-like
MITTHFQFTFIRRFALGTPTILAQSNSQGEQSLFEHADSTRVDLLPRIQRISVAYSHAGLASLDLVGAVIRQGAFVDKMVELQWTNPGRFEQSAQLAPLVRSIARYHAFLDLMSANPISFFVPTLVCRFSLVSLQHLTHFCQDIVGGDSVSSFQRLTGNRTWLGTPINSRASNTGMTP